MATFHSPNGVKLRCTAKRRYWVVTQWVRDEAPAARVELRTDNVTRARAEARKQFGRAIFDSATKEYIR